MKRSLVCLTMIAGAYLAAPIQTASAHEYKYCLLI
jgi:hypothetical protein